MAPARPNACGFSPPSSCSIEVAFQRRIGSWSPNRSATAARLLASGPGGASAATLRAVSGSSMSGSMPSRRSSFIHRGPHHDGAHR